MPLPDVRFGKAMAESKIREAERFAMTASRRRHLVDWQEVKGLVATFVKNHRFRPPRLPAAS